MAGNRTGLSPSWRHSATTGLWALVVFVLAGCTYRGQIDQPVTMKLTWFSYVAGDDIRAACAVGGQDSYRLIYNGSYTEQVRSYEVFGDGAGGGYYTARVISGSGLDLGRLSLRDPQAAASWRESRADLTPDDLSALRGALADSGAFSNGSSGLRLASAQFFWTSAVCRDGQFNFNAWLFPSDRYAQLRFPAALLERDQTGVPLNPPRKVVALETARLATREGDVTTNFNLMVGDDGLVTGPTF